MDTSRPAPTIPAMLIDLHEQLTDICLVMRRKFRDHFDLEKTSLNQYRILRVLKEHPSVSLSSLDETLTMKKGNLSRMVDGMVRKNMINRERDTSSDRRKIALSLTQKGDTILEELDKTQGELIKTLYQSVPEGEIEQIHEMLTRLQHYIRKGAT